MTQRQSFFTATKLNNIWNKIIQWDNYTLGTVMWHSGREWKVLPTGTTFDQSKQRNFQSIAEFHTQAELWEYIKTN